MTQPTEISISDAVAVINALINLSIAIFIGWQVRKMAESTNLSRRQNQHSLCLEIWREYNEQFDDRQALLQNPLNLEALILTYKDPFQIVNGPEYKRLRRVATVYGLAGSLMKAKAMEDGIIFNYITVPPRLWEAHWPLIKYLRESYYPHLFENWEYLYRKESNNWGKDNRAISETVKMIP